MGFRISRAASLLVLGALAPWAAAHDFWLEPSVWSAKTSQLVTFELRVGDDFRGEVVGRDEDFVERFIVSQDGGEAKPLRALPGRVTPAAFLRPGTAGRFVAGYESKPRELKLPASKFHRYLAEEGLEHVIDARREAGHADRPGHEHYIRCAKAVVSVEQGAPGPKFEDHLLGLALELQLLSDPRGAGPIKVRVLYGGKPLEGVLVDLTPRRPKSKLKGEGAEAAHGHDHGDHDHSHEHDHDHGAGEREMGHGDPKGPGVRSANEAPPRTDAKGIVTLRRRHPGPWLITAVHMEAAANTKIGRKLPRGDWISFWASLAVDGGVCATATPGAGSQAPITGK